jgi:hypothetical protein
MRAHATRYRVYPAAGGLPLCPSTEGRDLLRWDTRNLDADD